MARSIPLTMSVSVPWREVIMVFPHKLALFAMVAILPAAASADSVWIGELGTNPIKASDVKIQTVDGDNVTYVSESGASSTKTLSQLQLINVDGETNFDAAENAFITKSWNEAINGYESAMQASASKDWLKKRSALRLMIAAKQLNRFDAEVAAYVTLVQLDPSTAEASKPSRPPENSPYLDTAASLVGRALDNSQLNNAQKASLLGLQLDIYRAQKDPAKVNQAMQQLVAIGGGGPQGAAMVKLSAANVAYDSRQYAQAINTIEQNKAVFTEPEQQVDALWVLAESKNAVDGGKTDPDVLKDIALAYMRVVTFGNMLADKPHVSDALLRVSRIEQKLNDPKTAAEIDQQIIKSFGNSSAASEARAALKLIK